MTATELRMTGTPLDLALQAGDDVKIRFTFQTDVSAWTDWFAQVRARSGDTWDFAFNTAALDSFIVFATLTAAQTADMVGKRGRRWQFQAKDADGLLHTLFSGDVTVEEDEAQP